jgi:CheY-specific phosphatase CheX
MDNQLQPAALGAISHVFETMFFVFLEPVNPDSGAVLPGSWSPNEKWLQCRIGFQGNLRGQLRLFLPFPLAREMATNFLGLEEEASEQQVMDMTKELSNMICGNLFSRYERVRGYALTIPEAEVVRLEETDRPGSAPNRLRLDFLAEDRMIRLEIQVEDELHPGPN